MLQPLTEMGRGLSMSHRFVEDEACVVSLSRGGSVSVIQRLRRWILDGRGETGGSFEGGGSLSYR